MSDVLRLLCFLGFVCLGGAAAWTQRTSPTDPQSNKVLRLFLLYSVLVSFGAGLSQRELWPFSTWPLMTALCPPQVTHPRMLAVDQTGAEHPIDYRAWQPLPFDELFAWVDATFLRLPSAEAHSVGQYLVQRLETARLQAAQGRGVGYFHRFFGPLAAPYFLLHPALWSTPEAVPPHPFVGVRLYQETWQIARRHHDPSQVTRVLVYASPQP